jgi:hypothetical protein
MMRESEVNMSNMNKKRDENDTAIKLDLIIELLRQSLAIELYKSGASKDVIGKHLHIAKASVVKMLKGMSREHGNGG